MIKPNTGLEREAWEINNPALGSYMLWVCAIASFTKDKKPIHPSKLFCLFAFIFYEDTRSVLSSTKGGLQPYFSKFLTSKACATDIPLAIHYRVDNQKEKTLASLIIAFDSGLLCIDTDTGLITPNMSLKPIARSQLNATTKELVDCSKKIGTWFSEFTTQDLSRVIKVVF